MTCICAFSESYKALLFWEKAEAVKEYKVPPGVEKYKKLKAEGAEMYAFS